MAMRGGRGWQGNWGPFHFDFGDEGGRGGRGRGRRARRMFESGELRLVLLKLIADEPRHGYDLIRAIEELTGGEYAPSPGVVYPTLTLLQDMGLIEEAARRRPAQAVPGHRRGPRASRRAGRGGRRTDRAAERLEAARTQHERSGDRPRGQESDDRAHATASGAMAWTMNCSTRSRQSSTTRRSGSNG